MNDNYFLYCIKQILRYLPDNLYLRIKYRFIFGKSLNLKSPTSYNEKLQWLKLYDRRPEYELMVDKLQVKSLVCKKIGSQHVIPTLGYWNTPEEIEWDTLPDKFVLKTTHGGGNEGVIVCHNKKKFDRQKGVSILKRSLKQDLYKVSREWPYKGGKRRILAEKYMEDQYGELRDYKFFCFNGVVKALFVATGRQNRVEPFFNFFDHNYEPLPIRQGHPINPIIPPKPETFEQMKQIASNLSEGIPHVRVDLYEVNGTVFFGEYTFYHFGGTVPFEPVEWDDIFGSWLHLPVE